MGFGRDLRPLAVDSQETSEIQKLNGRIDTLVERIETLSQDASETKELRESVSKLEERIG